MIHVLVCLCGRHSFCCVYCESGKIQTCRFWQALKIAVSYLDSPEGLPAKQAAFLSGLSSSDYLTASANTKCP